MDKDFIKDQVTENQESACDENVEPVVSGDPLEVTEEETEQDEVTKMAGQIEQLEQNIVTLKDEKLRMMAEFENFRRNKAKEIAGLKEVLADGFFKDMLPVIDDIERAMQSLQQASDVVALKEGVELIYKKLLGFLEKNGVTPIDTVDADFDTNLHEAIAVLPAPNDEMKNKILDCTTRGYKHGETVIRHAKVVVGQ